MRQDKQATAPYVEVATEPFKNLLKFSRRLLSVP
jgi:hypothetical protein